MLPLTSAPFHTRPKFAFRGPLFAGFALRLVTLRNCLGAALLIGSAAAALAQGGGRGDREISPAEKRQGYSDRTFLAKARDTANLVELASAEAKDAVRLQRALGEGGRTRVLTRESDEPILATIQRLRATGRYEYVEPDLIVKADATPNDPRFLSGDQWALRNIGQSNGVAGADIRGEDGWEVRSSATDIVVAVIDSGIRRTHEDLVANLWINPGESGGAAGNGRDDDGNGYIDDLNGINAIPARTLAAGGNPVDEIGHGTAVASVIGATGNNRVGMTGVAWNVKLMSLRFLDTDGFGYLSDEIECIDYAVAKRAHLINASFGSGTYSQALFDTFKRARDAGIIVVCAAGNDGLNSDLTPHYPSGYLLENIVSVANTTRTDTLSPSSDFGTGLVDLGAPGTSILVANAASDRDYLFVSGTSFSTPMVTGALALIKARFPNEGYRDTINRLLRSVDAKPALTGKSATGGRLNLAAALRSTTARPFNDDFAQRGIFAGETGLARSSAQLSTREVGEPVHAGTPGNGSLWWTWTAPRSGAVTIDTTESAIDTLLAIYTGAAVSALTQVVVNDDESGTLKTSRVSFNAIAGTAYQIAVDSKGPANALVALRISLLAGNNDFASAQLVSGRSWSVNGDNRAANREAGEPRIRNNNGGRSMWYRWVAPVTRRYHIASWSGDFNTMLGIYTGSALTALSEVAAVTTGGDSNVTINSAATTLSATAGTTYYFVVDSEVSATGTSTSGDFKLACIDSDWEFFGTGAPNTPAIAADGTLHLVDDYGDVFGLNADGSMKWRYAMTGYGTFSAPAVAPDGTVYVGDDAGYLHAITKTGTRKWRFLAPGIIDSSPAIAPDGTIYIRSNDGRLHAINPDTGTARWSFRMGTSNTVSYSSPVVAPDGTIYCAGADSKLYAVAADGTQKWVYATDFIFASPALGADGTIHFGVIAPTRRFIALRPDGTQKWDFVVGDTVTSSAAIGLDGTLYFGSYDRRLYAVSATGELRWAYDTGAAIRGSSPVIASDGTIYIGSIDGKVHHVGPDGTLRRSYATGDEIHSSPILHNGRLYISSWDYRMYSIDVGQVPASSPWPMHRQNVRRTARSVTSALAIGVQPRAQSAEVGETITFNVGAVGAAPLSYQWFFNGQAVAGATATTYRVDPVIHANGGQYSARVTDNTGSLTSTGVALTVTTPLIMPSIFTPQANQTVIAGSPVTLTVSAIGSTPMTFQWLRDGVPVAGATSSSLSLADARTAVSGSYVLRITNFAGTITSAPSLLTVNPVSRISNLSIRTLVGGNTGTLTVGLTVGGEGALGTKPLLLRAAGPTLTAFGVGGTLADPRLALLSGQTTIGENDDWAGSAEIAATSSSVGAFSFASPTSKDAALAQAAAPGGYTVRISGPGTSSGVALAEVYDTTPSDDFVVSTPRLINVSALTQVGTGGDILIAGFSITGVTPKTVLVRGIGPTLAAFGVSGALADPVLDLYASGATSALSSNDNWSAASNATQVADAAAGVGAFALTAGSKDAVLLVTLPPGTYTAQISGVANTTGTALVEIYEVP